MPVSVSADKRKQEEKSATRSETRTSHNSKKASGDEHHKGKGPCKRKTQVPRTCSELELLMKEKEEKEKIIRAKSLRGSSKGDSKKAQKSLSLPDVGKKTQKDSKVRRSGNSQGQADTPKSRKWSKRTKQKKKKMAKQISNLVFVMPKTDDPIAKAQAASEKKISKLVRYMKKFWKIHVDKKFYQVKIDYRMADRMTHQRPNNWWLIKRARQKTLDHTGFFSNVREPYHDLGPPELDSAMLVFKNMHDDLLTDPSKWIQDRQLKDEIIRKCNAPLVRLPRAKVRRPAFNKGRVKVGAGGMLDINKYVQQGYAFQNAIQGDRTFSQTLDLYMDQKENDAQDMASAFGFVPKKTPDVGEHKPHEHVVKAGKSAVETEAEEKEVLQLHALQDDRKASHLDDRINQRVLLNFESMMAAIYILIRSMLNLKAVQLKTQYPLPNRVIISLRTTEPTDEKIKKKRAAPPVTCKIQGPKLEEKKSMKSITGASDEEEEEEEDNEEEEEEEDDEEEEDSLEPTKEEVTEEEDEEEEDEEEESYLEETRSQMLLRKANEERIFPVIPESRLQKIASSIVATIKQAHEENNKGLSPEEKIKSFQQTPEQAMSRRRSQVDKYNKLFHGGEPEKPPIWQNINMDHVFLSTVKPATVVKSVKHIESEAATDDFTSPTTPLPSTTRIPHVNEIRTPILSGLESPAKVDSEDQSRLNLLAKNPEAANDNPPPSPIQHLYKVAGIQTTEKQTFDSLMTMKKKFRVSEKALRFYYSNEIDKADWETQHRFRLKVRALEPCPIYERSIAMMRDSVNFPIPEDATASKIALGEKRPSMWYRKLLERFEELGAGRHVGCATILTNLLKYCDVDMKSRPKMPNRLCILVASLPTTELGTRPWQLAIQFLLDHLLGLPVELFHQWLEYRRLPPLI